ncbi:unnamed protein product [Parascedosporium putredinis]|uniref:Ricin B lectin domain-containing protein n=1 Tax=Parascedosporium putredinis TaxID=1442378 RepID=A0A9P1H902_9PEZI|nr:unnamed protein product [Parascedosporium putredinis]CAI8002979.1 unnamed protein product [Parascedosporium putredinis]
MERSQAPTGLGLENTGASNALVLAGPLKASRAVEQLDQAAFEEAQQRDDTATRAFSNVQITTSDGRCLFVDLLSGDFRANLTPLQVAACGSTDGQGWDVITAGKHNDQAGAALLVNTLSQACLNFDPRRAAGDQVNLFSCGGRADGGGEVTNSQLFDFAGGADPLALTPRNSQGQCLTVNGNVVGIAACDTTDDGQTFTIGEEPRPAEKTTGSAEDPADDEGEVEDPAVDDGEAAPGNDRGNNQGGGRGNAGEITKAVVEETPAAGTAGTGQNGGNNAEDCGPGRVVTVTETVQAPVATETGADITETAAATETPAASATEEATTSPTAPEQEQATTGGAAVGGVPTANPTEAVPVSRAGGTLNPTAAAKAHELDETATRAFTAVQIRSPQGQCLFVDPTAGDFRQNLIPVQLVDCTGSPNEQFDIITAGKHNNANGAALIVSTLTNGCISFDGRRPAGDTVTIFSCGGRAAGGETNTGQLVSFNGETELAFAPVSENGRTCLVDGQGRVDSAACSGNASQVFTIVA